MSRTTRDMPARAAVRARQTDVDREDVPVRRLLDEVIPAARMDQAADPPLLCADGGSVDETLLA